MYSVLQEKCQSGSSRWLDQLVFISIDGGSGWTISVEELRSFFGFCYARGELANGVRVKELWSKKWGLPIFSKTMSRDHFVDIINISGLIIDLSVLSACKMTDLHLHLEYGIHLLKTLSFYVPSDQLTIDEQLYPSKCRCPFTQYISTKPDKCGVKYFLLVDVESKYIYNGFPYLGKDHQRPSDQPFSSYVVNCLVQVLERNGHNTCTTTDTFFTSHTLTQDLRARGISLRGTARTNRRELPDISHIIKMKGSILRKFSKLTKMLYFSYTSTRRTDQLPY